MGAISQLSPEERAAMGLPLLSEVYVSGSKEIGTGAGQPLPAGMTCGDCVHFLWCQEVALAQEAQATCDWTPSAFNSGVYPTGGGSEPTRDGGRDRDFPRGQAGGPAAGDSSAVPSGLTAGPMVSRYPYTVTFDSRPTPARIGEDGDLYLDLGHVEHHVATGCAGEVLRQLERATTEQYGHAAPVSPVADCLHCGVGACFGSQTRPHKVVEWQDLYWTCTTCARPLRRFTVDQLRERGIVPPSWWPNGRLQPCLKHASLAVTEVSRG